MSTNRRDSNNSRLVRKRCCSSRSKSRTIICTGCKLCHRCTKIIQCATVWFQLSGTSEVSSHLNTRGTWDSLVYLRSREGTSHSCLPCFTTGPRCHKSPLIPWAYFQPPQQHNRCKLRGRQLSLTLLKIQTVSLPPPSSPPPRSVSDALCDSEAICVPFIALLSPKVFLVRSHGVVKL